MHIEASTALSEHKNSESKKIIKFFHHSTPMISIASKHFSSYSQKYIEKLFFFIPELFVYIQQFEITHLQLDLKHIYHDHDCCCNHFRMANFGKQLIDHIGMNRTLIYCDLGMFQNVIDFELLKQSVQNHPTLKSIDISRSNFFDGLPGCLFRSSDGVVQWK